MRVPGCTVERSTTNTGECQQGGQECVNECPDVSFSLEIPSEIELAPLHKLLTLLTQWHLCLHTYLIFVKFGTPPHY